MITHTVLLRLVDAHDVAEAKDRLEELSGQIETLRSLSVGLDLLGTDASYDLVLVTTHDDLAGLTAYQEHPVHVEFVDWLRPRLAARAVVDADL